MAHSDSDTCSPDDLPTRDQMIWQVVWSIPEGRVANYGQVARLAGLPGLARYVGRALGKLPPGSEVPWYRVLKSDGRLAFKPGTHAYIRQSESLQHEGVEVADGRVSMARYRWEP
ncbi:MAG: MGMT family protein [Marinobacter sp.]|uniref:MGMT family protein n=1 Tax=Marinobacter sp. TaxID=50741 RepID=UPI0034A00424